MQNNTFEEDIEISLKQFSGSLKEVKLCDNIIVCKFSFFLCSICAEMWQKRTCEWNNKSKD